MSENKKTKEQLFKELAELRQENTTLKAKIGLTIGKEADITERRHTVEDLSESLELCRDFIESSMDLIFVKDSEFRNIIVNKRYLEFWSKTESEIISKTDYDFMPLDVAESCRRSDMQTIKQQGILITLEPVDDKIYETRKFPVQLKEGKTGVGGFVRDITERKQKEKEIEKRVEELELFHRLAVGRELQMIELKQKINELSSQLGHEKPYDLAFLNEI